MEICHVGPGFPVKHAELAMYHKWQLVDYSDVIRIFRFVVSKVDNQRRVSELVEPPNATIDEFKGSPLQIWVIFLACKEIIDMLKKCN